MNTDDYPFDPESAARQAKSLSDGIDQMIFEEVYIMPTWDYKCELCLYTVGLRFRNLAEADRDVPLYTCPNCDAEGVLHRQPSAPSFIVTGFNSKNNYSR